MKKGLLTTILIAFIFCVVALSCAGCVTTDTKKPILYASEKSFVKAEDSPDGYATRYLPDGTDGKILLLADPQLDPTEKYGVVGSKNELTLKFLDKLLDATKPDLVIIAGDIAMTGFLANWQWFAKIADVMESKNVPWSFTFGNHDCENGFYSDSNAADGVIGQLSKANLIDLVREKYPLCLIDSSDCESGYGNHFINVRNASGKLLTTICNLDCVYKDASDYSRVIDSAQTAWYGKHIQAICEQNEEIVPSLVVTHVALPEAFIGWKNAFDGSTPNSSYRYGRLIDGDYSKYATETDFFATMQSLGSTKAVFFGHHHSNDASVEYGGIDLTFIQHSGMSHEYRTTHTGSYGITGWPKDSVFDLSQVDTYGDCRGGTMVTVDSNGGFSYEPVYAKDVIPDYKDWAIDYDAVAKKIAEERGVNYVIRGKK